MQCRLTVYVENGLVTYVNKLQLKCHKVLYAAVRCAFINNHLFRRHRNVHARTRTLHKCPYTASPASQAK